ncbi:MAG: glycosyltransferase family 4 protein [Myxococcota bacterium]
MHSYLAAFLLALLVSLGLTPLVIRVAFRLGWLDVPTDSRKVHKRPIPRVGGIAVVIAFMTPLIGLFFYSNGVSEVLYADGTKVAAFFSACVLIVALGVYDDLKGTGAGLKFSVQTIAAAVVWSAGIRIEMLGIPLGDAFQVSFLSFPLTWLWVVGVVNALNLIDGLDGLASGLSLFACFVLFAVAVNDHAVLLCLMVAALSGALVGFLVYNFNPAKIFLGDSGSMFLGFVLSTVSIWTQRKGATATALLIPMMALGLPLLDTGLAFTRRVLKRSNPFRADRQHLHHRLLALGLSHRNAVLTLYTASGIFALASLALLQDDAIQTIIAILCVSVVLYILARRIGVLSMPQASIQADHYRQVVRQAGRSIRQATSEEQVWSSLELALNELQAAEASLAWRAPVSDNLSCKEYVYRWANPDTRHAARQNRELEISDAGMEFGTLRLAFNVQTDKSTSDLCSELLREALVDYAWAKASISSNAGIVLPFETRLSKSQ